MNYWNTVITPKGRLLTIDRKEMFGAGQFSWTDLGYSAGCMMVLLVVGVLMFTRKQKAFIDTI